MLQSKVFYRGVPYEPEKLKVLGKGAEGTVYCINGSGKLAMKIYHGWNLLDSDPSRLNKEETNQLIKLDRVGKKLMEYPHGLTDRVAKPVGLVLDEKRRKIVGFCMPYIEGFSLSMFESKSFRRGFQSLDIMVDALKELHTVVRSLHKKDVLVVDFASDNVIFQQIARFLRIYMVDFDSMQWGRFVGDGFHWQTVDPKIIRRTPSSIALSGQFSKESDWYSFTVITMSTLTTINPYVGPIASRALYRWNNISAEQRPTLGLNVFHPDVEYPKAGIPLEFFPKELVSYWKETISGSNRGEFPIRLLSTLSWKTCPKCKTRHANSRCPVCH